MLIDTHCHILPSLDDGAESMVEAIEMARYAVQRGVNTIVATPHYTYGSYNNDAVSVRNAVNEFVDELKMQGIKLTVHPGQEVRVFKYFMEDLLSGKILTLNETQYLLLELPSIGVPDYFDELLHELRVIHLTPVLAHPERNAEFLKFPNRLREYVENGLICQVTSDSFSGLFGSKIRKFAYDLCKQNLVHIIASDAHNVTTRQGNLTEVMRAISTSFGIERAQYYVHNAARLINGDSIVSQSFGGRKFFWLNRHINSLFRQG